MRLRGIFRSLKYRLNPWNTRINFTPEVGSIKRIKYFKAYPFLAVFPSMVEKRMLNIAK